jgi:hypothetical protein
MNPMLVSVAEAVADGVPVDWEGLMAAEPEVAEHLGLLRLFEGIIAAHRDLGAPPRGPTAP